MRFGGDVIMRNLSNLPVCLYGESAYCLSLFKQLHDIEYYQLKIGLGSLCQNTLIYQSIDEMGNKVYRTIQSSHADEFYCDECRRFRANDETCGEASCEALLERITLYFCEPEKGSLSEDLNYEILEYSNHFKEHLSRTVVLSGKYIRYRCPFVDCYKYGFPIYINGKAIAVLFTGQFFLQEPSVESSAKNQGIWAFWGQNIFRQTTGFQLSQISQDDSQAPCMQNKYFDCIADLEKFIYEDIVPIIGEFTFIAQNNYELRLVENFDALIVNANVKLDKLFASFISQFLKNSMLEGPGISESKQFWSLVKDSLFECLRKSEIDAFYLFVDHPEASYYKNELYGIALQEKAKKRGKILFKYASAQKAISEISDIYGADIKRNRSGVDFFDYIRTAKAFDPTRAEILFNATALPPFAIVYEFSAKSEIISRPFLRHSILTQFDRFFQKVGQLLTYLSAKLSEHNLITVLRIYRHEITHQVSALDQNLWELEPKRFKSLDENKLEKVISDHKQCLFVLDFMTQNMDVITGRINEKVATFDHDHEIDIASDIFNKAISLNQNVKIDKQLWFEIQNRSRQKHFTGCLELIDMVFFNLMSNALKYAYEGTKIILGFQDTSNYGRPHLLSITDFGYGIETTNQNQLFEIYYREKNSASTEGSGIGLFVAKKVSELLDATLSWRCELVSNYHIPSLACFLAYAKDKGDNFSTDVAKANAEYIRLVNAGKWNTVLNKEYLSQPSMWNYNEVLGQLKTNTYQVTFELNF